MTCRPWKTDQDRRRCRRDGGMGTSLVFVRSRSTPSPFVGGQKDDASGFQCPPDLIARRLIHIEPAFGFKARARSGYRALSASVSCVQPSNARAARDCRAVIMHDHLPPAKRTCQNYGYFSRSGATPPAIRRFAQFRPCRRRCAQPIGFGRQAAPAFRPGPCPGGSPPRRPLGRDQISE